MRREDPKRVKARADRERTMLWLEIHCKGIGQVLAESCRYPEEQIRPIIDYVNGPLMEAVEAAEKADKAWQAYWSRPRHRHIRVVRKAAKKKKAA